MSGEEEEGWCSVGAWERCSEATAQENQEEEEEKKQDEEEEQDEEEQEEKTKMGIFPDIFVVYVLLTMWQDPMNGCFRNFVCALFLPGFTFA